MFDQKLTVQCVLRITHHSSRFSATVMLESFESYAHFVMLGYQDGDKTGEGSIVE